MAIVLTRDGILFSSERDPRRPPRHDPGAGGLYRLAGGPVQILAGVVNPPTVSPDGCKVAFGYGPKFSALYAGTEGAVTMVVADVCDHSSGGRPK
jgi:hypothetical protein